MQIKHNKVRIPTGGRLTSRLFTQRGGVEFGATEDKSIQWQGGGFEPGTYGVQIQRPTTRPRSPPQLCITPQVFFNSCKSFSLLVGYTYVNLQVFGMSCGVS